MKYWLTISDIIAFSPTLFPTLFAASRNAFITSSWSVSPSTNITSFGSPNVTNALSSSIPIPIGCILTPWLFILFAFVFIDDNDEVGSPSDRNTTYVS